ncbi:MAG: glycosyltransferase [Pseudomarimonas sp.]
MGFSSIKIRLQLVGRVELRFAINALPITNFSGRRVLLGHLRNLAQHQPGRDQFVVLHHAGNRDIRCDLGANVEWVECEKVGTHWFGRLLWESAHMRRELRRLRVDALISTSGALVPRAGVPQWVWAQNPWCFFPQFHFGLRDRLKAAMQRKGYRSAQQGAAAVFYLSDFMARSYASNAGCKPRHGATTYVGVDDAMFEAAGEVPAFGARELEIVTVSVMTPHKAIEDVVDALAALHGRGLAARLALVGPWADAGYRTQIEGRMQRLQLTPFVTITGPVSNDELMQHYRRARVFCLLSRCESFGIPAVEAQAFGTPSVVADACAPPEVAGPGGRIVAAGDIDAAADALAHLLTDDVQWQQASMAALSNVERFRWKRVSQPMLDWLDITAAAR